MLSLEWGWQRTMDEFFSVRAKKRMKLCSPMLQIMSHQYSWADLATFALLLSVFWWWRQGIILRGKRKMRRDHSCGLQKEHSNKLLMQKKSFFKQDLSCHLTQTSLAWSFFKWRNWFPRQYDGFPLGDLVAELERDPRFLPRTFSLQAGVGILWPWPDHEPKMCCCCF